MRGDVARAFQASPTVVVVVIVEDDDLHTVVVDVPSEVVVQVVPPSPGAAEPSLDPSPASPPVSGGAQRPKPGSSSSSADRPGL